MAGEKDLVPKFIVKDRQIVSPYLQLVVGVGDEIGAAQVNMIRRNGHELYSTLTLPPYIARAHPDMQLQDN